MRALVAALGNPLAGDDGFAAAVLNLLETGPPQPTIDFINAGADLLSLLERFFDYERVILLDAILDPENAGNVAVYEEEAILSLADDSPSAHQLSPLMSIQLFRTLHPSAPTRFYLVGFACDRISMEEGFRRESSAKTAAEQVWRLLS